MSTRVEAARRAGCWVGVVAALALGAAGCGAMKSPSMYSRGYPSMAPPPPPAAMATAMPPGESQEAYKHQADNPYFDARTSPLSTFSVDVDTASYSNVRRILREGRLPPPDAVRIEEMLNYFTYAYEAPRGEAPVAIDMDAAPCPWEPSHRLVRLGVRARAVQASQVGPRNLVFLLDVSGSMWGPNRLPMLKQAMRILVDQLEARDTVAIVVYAGASGLVLPATPGDRKGEINAALEGLQAGGSTNGGAGIELAYRVAQESFQKGGINRVILATDGDFNVGTSSEGELVRLIEEKRKSGVFLSVLGVGEGNVKDSHMEALADKGNGNYAYLDSMAEARKVLGAQSGGTLITVAKDVKLQVEFNPQQVQSYRLLGYENRVLNHQDFKDDSKDAGDMGSGHTVTALYEVVPPGGAAPAGTSVDALKYQAPAATAPAAAGGEWLTVKLRYKTPDGDRSQELVQPFTPRPGEPAASTRFAAAVAEFGLLLRQSPHRGASSYEHVASVLAEQERGGQPDPQGYRAELRQLVETARKLAGPGREVAR